MTEKLLANQTTALAQNTIYAVPTGLCYIFADAGLEVCNSTAFSTIGTISATTPTVIAGEFVRCTSAATVVSLRKA
jgi:hypothetical protein